MINPRPTFQDRTPGETQARLDYSNLPIAGKSLMQFLQHLLLCLQPVAQRVTRRITAMKIDVIGAARYMTAVARIAIIPWIVAQQLVEELVFIVDRMARVVAL